MPPVTYQTVKLRKGRHGSPEEGACMMELASMLAGEPFSDHPVSVCPVIGACVRASNDWVDDARRQDLYPLAAKVVGTCGPEECMRAREQRVKAWAGEVRRLRWAPFLLTRSMSALTLWPQPEDLGSHVIQAVARRKRRAHQEVLALIDELVAMGVPDDSPPTSGATRRPIARPALREPAL